jgi:DNA invertase Pin-like site-specific DNA recombinase
LYRLQNLDSQEDRKKFGCEKVVTDHTSGAKSNIPGLEIAIEFVSSRDALVVWRLDCLRRNMGDLVTTV